MDENLSHYFRKTENNDDEEDKLNFSMNVQTQKLFLDYTFDIDKHKKQKEIIKKIRLEREKEREKERERREAEGNNMGGTSGITGTTRGNTKFLTTVNSIKERDQTQQ